MSTISPPPLHSVSITSTPQRHSLPQPVAPRTPDSPSPAPAVLDAAPPASPSDPASPAPAGDVLAPLAQPEAQVRHLCYSELLSECKDMTTII